MPHLHINRGVHLYTLPDLDEIDFAYYQPQPFPEHDKCMSLTKARRRRRQRMIYDFYEYPGGFWSYLYLYSILILIVSMTTYNWIQTIPDMAVPDWPIGISEGLFAVSMSIEYCLRLWSCRIKCTDSTMNHTKFRLRYALTFKMVMILIMIIMSLLVFIIYIVLLTSDASTVWTLTTIVRLVRLVFVFAALYPRQNKWKTNALDSGVLNMTFRQYVYPLTAMWLISWLVVIVSGSVLYYVERDSVGTKLTSLPITLYWGTITWSSIGYGDITPTTGWGYLWVSITAYFCLAMYSLPIGVFSTAIAVNIDNAASYHEKRVDMKVVMVRQIQVWWRARALRARTPTSLRLVNRTMEAASGHIEYDDLDEYFELDFSHETIDGKDILLDILEEGEPSEDKSSTSSKSKKRPSGGQVETGFLKGLGRKFKRSGYDVPEIGMGQPNTGDSKKRKGRHRMQTSASVTGETNHRKGYASSPFQGMAMRSTFEGTPSDNSNMNVADAPQDMRRCVSQPSIFLYDGNDEGEWPGSIGRNSQSMQSNLGSQEASCHSADSTRGVKSYLPIHWSTGGLGTSHETQSGIMANTKLALKESIEMQTRTIKEEKRTTQNRKRASSKDRTTSQKDDSGEISDWKTAQQRMASDKLGASAPFASFKATEKRRESEGKSKFRFDDISAQKPGKIDKGKTKSRKDGKSAYPYTYSGSHSSERLITASLTPPEDNNTPRTRSQSPSPPRSPSLKSILKTTSAKGKDQFHKSASCTSHDPVKRSASDNVIDSPRRASVHNVRGLAVYPPGSDMTVSFDANPMMRQYGPRSRTTEMSSPREATSAKQRTGDIRILELVKPLPSPNTNAFQRLRTASKTSLKDLASNAASTSGSNKGSKKGKQPPSEHTSDSLTTRTPSPQEIILMLFVYRMRSRNLSRQLKRIGAPDLSVNDLYYFMENDSLATKRKFKELAHRLKIAIVHADESRKEVHEERHRVLRADNERLAKTVDELREVVLGVKQIIERTQETSSQHEAQWMPTHSPPER